jgi:hypothetical protein
MALPHKLDTVVGGRAAAPDPRAQARVSALASVKGWSGERHRRNARAQGVPYRCEVVLDAWRQVVSAEEWRAGGVVLVDEELRGSQRSAGSIGMDYA